MTVLTMEFSCPTVGLGMRRRSTWPGKSGKIRVFATGKKRVQGGYVARWRGGLPEALVECFTTSRSCSRGYFETVADTASVLVPNDHINSSTKQHQRVRQVQSLNGKEVSRHVAVIPERILKWSTRHGQCLHTKRPCDLTQKNSHKKDAKSNHRCPRSATTLCSWGYVAEVGSGYKRTTAVEV